MTLPFFFFFFGSIVGLQCCARPFPFLSKSLPARPQSGWVRGRGWSTHPFTLGVREVPPLGASPRAGLCSPHRLCLLWGRCGHLQASGPVQQEKCSGGCRAAHSNRAGRPTRGRCGRLWGREHVISMPVLCAAVPGVGEIDEQGRQSPALCLLVGR